jgi:hypothetical protein
VTIDINTLGVGQPCPCNVGWISHVDTKLDAFSCSMSAGHYVAHASLPGGGYTNLTNVVVTPARPIRVRVTPCTASTVPASPKYPHVCPTCRGAVYVGFTAIEHAATGGARCP